MATPDTRVATVERSLEAIGTICDLGFALAVHIRLTRPTLLYQTYADDWSENYSTKGYMMSDPSVAWGLLVITVLSYFLARSQNERPLFIIAEHLGIAILVVVFSHYIGVWVAATFE